MKNSTDNKKWMNSLIFQRGKRKSKLFWHRNSSRVFRPDHCYDALRDDRRIVEVATTSELFRCVNVLSTCMHLILNIYYPLNKNPNL